MCGFAGFYDKHKRFIHNGRDTVREMSHEIRHRGPDSEGSYSDAKYSVGFRRLKILDINNGDQPFFSDCGRYVLCFNGEIYNHVQLKNMLKDRFGVRFKTTSDTEVLLYCLIKFGNNALPLLRGMYAFAFYDRENSSLLCARDPFGIKPFYYSLSNDCLIFASEIKAMLKHPLLKKEFNSDILPLYLQFQYVPTEETAFKNVFRLPGGHTLFYSENTFEIQRFHHLPTPSKSFFTRSAFTNEPQMQKKYKSDTKSFRGELIKTIEGSVALHTKCDVPYSTFLSGGVDSALITTLVKPSVSYCCGFPENDFNESPYALETAERIGAHLINVICDAESFFKALPDVQYYADEPYANLSAVPLYLLSKRASRDVKVILSGEGADELFGGYALYRDHYLKNLLRLIPETKGKTAAKLKSKAPKKLVRLLEQRNELHTSYLGQARICSPQTAASLLRCEYSRPIPPSVITSQYFSKCSGASVLKKKMYLDLHLWLPFDILNKADKMTMANSLELRVPYLDNEVLKVAELLKDSSLVSRSRTKLAFRKAACAVLDKKTAFREKKGFPVPFREWIKTEKYSALLLSAFKSPECARFFNTDTLIRLLSDHILQKENNARLLYTVYAFYIWYCRYFGSTVNNEPERNKT